MVCKGIVSYAKVWYGMHRYGMVCKDMVWYAKVWYGMQRYGMVCKGNEPHYKCIKMVEINAASFRHYSGSQPGFDRAQEVRSVSIRGSEAWFTTLL